MYVIVYHVSCIIVYYLLASNLVSYKKIIFLEKSFVFLPMKYLRDKKSTFLLWLIYFQGKVMKHFVNKTNTHSNMCIHTYLAAYAFQLQKLHVYTKQVRLLCRAILPSNKWSSNIFNNVSDIWTDKFGWAGSFISFHLFW